MRLLLLLAVSLALLTTRGYSQAALRAGDTFDMRLTGMPQETAADFTGQFTVSDDGNVSVPLIGAVKAAGLSAPQLAQAIDNKLVAGKIFTHPTAIITLQQQSRTVTIGGGVRSPQALPWTSDLTLQTAIMRVGGASDYGNIAKIKLTRGTSKSVFNLKKVDKDPNQNPKLLPGDVVEVPE